MAITFHKASKVFTIQTNQSTYQFQIGKYGYLIHLYYGAKIEKDELTHLVYKDDRGFSGNPYEAYLEEEEALLQGKKLSEIRSFSLDTYPQEYTTFGSGDFRASCLAVAFSNGSQTTELRYKSHKIYDGKYRLPGLPSMWEGNPAARDVNPNTHVGVDECQTLEITLKDPWSSLEVILYYGVFPKYDIITRAAKIRNMEEDVLYLNRALSVSLDFHENEYDFITFYGRHYMERQVLRHPVFHGKQSSESTRGTSSPQHNPFTILCERNANEDFGSCFGMSFVYSGNFLAEVEVDQYNQTRFVMGIHPTGFRWCLRKGESFTTPEVVLSYSPDGLTKLSQNFHKAYRHNLSISRFTNKRRPILINNWEATKYNFDDKLLMDLATEAKALGIEMLVMDDGWFGKRNHDREGLGDWFVNEEKIRRGLKGLVKDINDLGMKFGIWVEPEMINEESRLFQTHPDWCLGVPGRKGVYSRSQLVLDISREDVRNYLFDSIGKILTSTNIEYVKWDMNRHLTDVWSRLLPAERQGEVYHRYVLGLYELLERFHEKYPYILFESCSGGGGRFDAGMLYYMPQTWCSDNTDAIDRIRIQHGTSYGYPISSVGAHVSVVPNHHTKRVVPLKTRGIVAMAGTFGYELDITQMTSEEKELVREQIEDFKRNYDLIQYGDYFRLTNPEEKHDFAAWEFVKEDKTKALVCAVILHALANPPALRMKLKGLNPQWVYSVKGLDLTLSGAALKHGGIVLPKTKGDFMGFMFELEKLDGFGENA